jgi:hypothetical protein
VITFVCNKQFGPVDIAQRKLERERERERERESVGSLKCCHFPISTILPSVTSVHQKIYDTDGK